MEQELSKYLEQKLRSALDGELPPSWPSPEADHMGQMLRSVFSDELSDQARHRVFVRLGLVGLSTLVQRHRAAAIAGRTAMRCLASPASGDSATHQGE